MRAFLGLVLLSLAFSSCATPPGPATKLEKANVLPLALNDHFQIRKTIRYFNESKPGVTTLSEPIQFERSRMNWGLIDSYDFSSSYGNYFTFFWRTSQQADVTIRLEYRQAALGNYVMAQERYYPSAKGSYRSPFNIIGDEYAEFGRVTSWRVLLIVEGRIVALKQSYMWR